MVKTILDDISFEGLGLLMFLIREKDKNNVVNMGYREIAKRINKGEHWVRLMIKTFTKKKFISLINGEPSDAVSDAVADAVHRTRKVLINVHVTVVLENTSDAVADAVADAKSALNFDFEDVWKKYGKIGSKKMAKSRYEKLSNIKKKELFESIPYYKAFHDPGYFLHLSTYISHEEWNNIERYNGVEIPKDNYHTANAEKFIEWFNSQVQGTNIPQISSLTPQRRRMLNICYTLCYKEMSKVMGILITNQRYIEMANKGMVDFDYIYKPENMRRICENGEY